LTNTITSILGNTVTVISALVAMILIDWRLTIIAVIMMPALVLVQGGGAGAGPYRGADAESLSELTSITQETLSVAASFCPRPSTANGRSRSATAQRTSTRCVCRCAGP
jgi:ABC-type multidrug transport system fused ATPase/permease subunit